MRSRKNTSTYDATYSLLPYKRNICEPLNTTRYRIVRVAAAIGLAQEFRIVLQAKVKIKNSTSSVYLMKY